MIAQASRQPELNCLARVNRYLYEFLNDDLYIRNVRHGYGSAVFWAARHGRLDTFEHLRKAGAEWNDQSASYSDDKLARSVCPYLPGQILRNMYFSPLHIAAKFGQDEAVQWLLYVTSHTFTESNSFRDALILLSEESC